MRRAAPSEREVLPGLRSRPFTTGILLGNRSKTTATSAPSGERRRATVLSLDLSCYTVMNETLDPEEVEGVMRHIKSEAARIVEGHGGIVNPFVGDEVLAQSGPNARETIPLLLEIECRAPRERTHVHVQHHPPDVHR